MSEDEERDSLHLGRDEGRSVARRRCRHGHRAHDESRRGRDPGGERIPRYSSYW